MSRTRSHTDNPVAHPFSGITIKEKWNNQWYDPVVSLPNGSFFSQSWKTMTDEVSPGYFKAKRENNLLPSNPMTSTKVEVVSQPGSTSGLSGFKTAAKRDGYSFESSGDWGFKGPFIPPPECSPPNKAVLLQEALSRAQTDAWDTLTFAAEFRKTVEGVVTLRSRMNAIIDRVENAVLHRRRSKKWKFMSLTDIVAQIWLELRYMWRPLVYDMMAMEEAYGRMAEERAGSLQRSYASGSTSDSVTRVLDRTEPWSGPSGQGGGGAFAPYIVTTTSVLHTGHASVGVTIDTRSVTMTDPLVTAWELVPFSFVLDWFVTFGSMLSAFSPFASSNVKFATYTLTSVVEQRVTVVPRPVDAFRFVEGTASPSVNVRLTTTKKRTLEVVTPTLTLDINLNAAKISDLAALWSVMNRKTLLRIMR